MRILLVSHGAGPYGAERVGVALARGLAGRGHDVVMDFPHGGPAVDAAREPGAPRVRVGARHRLPRNAAEAVGWAATSPAAVLDVRRTVRDVDPDLVWINSLYNPWAGVAGLGRRRVVWHLHEYRLPEPLGVTAAALIGAATTRVAVVSDFLAEGWRRYPWLRGRISVLPNPLLGFPRAGGRGDALGGEPAGPFTVGYLGQLEPRKRVPDLIEAVARLPGVRAVIVGDGKARSAAEAAVRDVGVGDRVELGGFRADIDSELARFHCMAVPSLREPFGLVALEAMAAGVPVVAARSGALPDVLGDAALYHAPRDPADLAARIAELKADPALRAKLVDRGRERVQAYREDAWLDRAEIIARETTGEIDTLKETETP